MKEYLIELKDSKLVDYKDSSKYIRGYCDTCDIGSVYLSEIVLMFQLYSMEKKKYTLKVSSKRDFSKCCSQVNVIKILANLDKDKEGHLDCIQKFKDLADKDKEDLEVTWEYI